jgi:hypothetical protein
MRQATDVNKAARLRTALTAIIVHRFSAFVR